MKLIYSLPLAACILLTGCNSMYIKPNTLDKSKTIYADRGGYSMKRSIKERLESRGYHVIVGKASGMKSFGGETDIELDSYNIMNAHYVVKVAERRETFNSIWCPLNGFWWWNFNLSIADQSTGEEILSWRGRGCANSSLKKLDAALDQMEIN
jgi:hypothetical protein